MGDPVTVSVELTEAEHRTLRRIVGDNYQRHLRCALGMYLVWREHERDGAELFGLGPDGPQASEAP